jgi:hypothetical protein
MSRFTMTLAAAAVSAVAAIAAVALPAGADFKTSGQPAKAAGDIGAFASCLRGHGLADAPTDPAQLKPWLAARQASASDAVKAAVAACDDRLPDEKRAVVRGPDMQELVACVRAHGLDAPTGPDAFKRWVAEQDASDPGALSRVIGACKMALDPGPPHGAATPGTCDADAKLRPPSDDAAKLGT